MASVDKLVKTFEILKIPVQLYEAEQRKQDVKQIAKKDKITHLNFVFDCITSTNVRQSEEYTRMLSLSTEAFLAYVDDDDQDVYFVAEECLNKTIKTLVDTNLNRFPADLYRFIKRNGPERSLRCALIRFADLIYHIKPHKCRIYVEFIIKENTLGKLANRNEESIQNVLVSCMIKICGAFGWSMTDNEINSVLQSFLPNLSNNSSVNSYRRVSANCLSIICLYSRAPFISYHYLHNELLKLIIPLEESDLNKFTIWGVLMCFRFIIMHISELSKCFSPSSTTSALDHATNSSANVTPSKQPQQQQKSKKQANLQYFGLKNLCQIYEICMYYLNNEDNRIVIASLECLQLLIKLAPLKFAVYLTRSASISTSTGRSHLTTSKSFGNIGAESNEGNAMTNSITLSNKLSNSLDSLTTLKPPFSSTSGFVLDAKQANVAAANADDKRSETASQSNSNVADSSAPYEPVKSPNQLIGTFYDKNREPILYLVRLLCYKFLLNTNSATTTEEAINNNKEQSKLKPDSEVKVIVKALALDCCSSAISLCPHVLLKSVYTSSSSSDLYVYDLLEYVKHKDDKMRTTTCLLMGQFIQSVLVENDGDYDSWLLATVDKYRLMEKDSDAAVRCVQRLRLDSLVDALLRFIRSDNAKFTSNICKRFAVMALRCFLPTLVRTRHSSYALEILVNLLHLRHSTYNLVKCELVDLMASIDFKCVLYAEQIISRGERRVPKSSKKATRSNDIAEKNEEEDNEEDEDEDNEEDEDEDDDDDDDDEDDEEDFREEEENDEAQQFSAANQNKHPPSNSPWSHPIRHTQERIIDDVFIYLLGSEDNKVRLETARALIRLVMNMNFYEMSSNSNQNLLLGAAESLLKSDGFASNLLNSSVIDNDAYNLHTVNLVMDKCARTSSSAPSPVNAVVTSFTTPTSLLHSMGSKRQYRFACSPLSAPSILSSLPWFSKTNQVLNNNFIQPFYSLIKFWPSNFSNSHVINNNLNKFIEHNLNYLVPLLVKTLIESIDKYQLIGCFEAFDFLFQTYNPAIFYASSVSSQNSLNSLSLISNDSNSNFQQIYDLIALFISYLKHPVVAFDLYLHEILLRLIGTLFSSYTWLHMKKLDKMLESILMATTTMTANNNNSANPSNQQSSAANYSVLIESLNTSIRPAVCVNSQAELATGLTYSYSFTFNNSAVKSTTDGLFVHCMRTLCVLAAVVDETALPSVLTANLNAGSTAVSAPPPPSQTAPSQSASTTSVNSNSASSIGLSAQAANSVESSPAPSFLRAKLTDLKQSATKAGPTSSNLTATSTPKAASQSNASIASGTGGGDQSNDASGQSSSLPKTNTSVYLGYFQASSHYLKLYETSKLAFNLYKKSAQQIGAYDRFTNLVKGTLYLFAQLLEASLSVHEVGPHLDEILLYLRVLFTIEPSCTVKCVTLCLKSLFGLNLSGLLFEYIQQQLTKLVSSASSASTSKASTTATTPTGSSTITSSGIYSSNTSSMQNSTSINSINPISGLLSTSLQSLTSINQSTTAPLSHQVASSWSLNSRRNQSSLYSIVMSNHLSQFTRFIYAQTIMHKNDSGGLLGAGGVQFNPNLVNLGVIGLDSIEYINSSSVVTASTAQNTSGGLLLAASNSNVSVPNLTTQPAAKYSSSASLNSTSSSGSASKAVVKSGPFGTGFNLFGLIRKPSSVSKVDEQAAANEQAQKIQQQQQQSINEQQQQKLKQQKSDLKTIGQYIKSFESIVIKSLRQYTLTTSVNLQARILELLTQLIFLKVDYCLLDSDKVFIDYVLKQFEYIEQKRSGGDYVKNSSSGSVINDSCSSSLDERTSGSDVLAKCHMADVSETFDAETLISDPLNPFDLDTQLSRLFAQLASPQSAFATLTSSMRRSSMLASLPGAASSTEQFSHTPLVSALYSKQQEHQRGHLILPKLFDFLILLSHEKKLQPQQQSNVASPPRGAVLTRPIPTSLITVPEIMQLCDNLIASENSPQTHAIPAMRPLVIDLFLYRTFNADESVRELEMQQDVIMATMLKLIHYPQIWPLLTIAITKYKRDNEEKWKKCSRQICDAIFDSMRSNGVKLRFADYTGSELRSVRRYSRSNLPYMDSLKQLLVLFNWLSPQVFRPVDFIILSLFETCKSFLTATRELTGCEINYLLCVLLVHVYLLLTNSTEDQILRRLHHLCPQIIESFSDASSSFTPKSNRMQHTSNASARSQFANYANKSAKVAQTQNMAAANSKGPQENEPTTHPLMTDPLTSAAAKDDDDNESTTNSSTSYSSYSSDKRGGAGVGGGLGFNENSFYIDDDESELNVTESALFLGKFLLRIVEVCMTHIDRSLRFNASMLISSVHLSSPSSTPLQRDSLTNTTRELHYTQHLLANYLVHLVYLLQCGNYPKMSAAFTSLVEIPPQPQTAAGTSSCSSSSSNINTTTINEQFNYDSSKFAIHVNRMILFKISKANPLLATLWQHFLVLCNYQDPEYWLLSLESTSKSHHHNNNEAASAAESSSSAYNSLNPESAAATNLEETDSIASAKILRSKIRSMSNYRTLRPLSASTKLAEIFSPTLDEDLIVTRSSHTPQKTLNEQLFKYLSMTIYCENIATRNQLNNTIGLTMLIINNLSELFELASNESIVLDLFSLIHRNAAASSLFVHSVATNWRAIASGGAGGGGRRSNRRLQRFVGGSKKLYLMHACLKSLEGVHLASSGHLLNLLIDKFFRLPYLSLVRYADHIACQRVEMIQSLSLNELANQFTEQQLKKLDKFFTLQFRYSYRHQRLMQLLEQLRKSIDDFNIGEQRVDNNMSSLSLESPSTPSMPPLLFGGQESTFKSSPSIDFFRLYLTTPAAASASSPPLDKEWYYNIVNSACSSSSTNTNTNDSEELIKSSGGGDNSSLKPKQCALMLSNLDTANIISILASKRFRLGILRECILLGAHRTQIDISKLPSVLKQAATSGTNLSLQNDFMHPLWLASTQYLFAFLKDISPKLPEPSQIVFNFNIESSGERVNSNQNESLKSIYESKLDQLFIQHDFHSYFAAITEAINSYLKCIRQYPSLQNQLSSAHVTSINDLISFILFQMSLVNHMSMSSSKAAQNRSTSSSSNWHVLSQSFLCVFNLLVDHLLLEHLCKRANYSTLVSQLVDNFYQLIVRNFFRYGDDHVLSTPNLVANVNIDYKSGASFTNDVLFNTSTFETMLKLRFIIVNGSFDRETSGGETATEASSGGSGDTSGAVKSSFGVSSQTHRYLQQWSGGSALRAKLPCHMRDLIEKIYIGLCRLPVLDRFMRIPDALWRMHGFRVDYRQLLKSDTSTLPPLEYLREPGVLKEHLKHIQAVGWTTRNQFEYEYVNMLTLLHNLSDDYYLPMSTGRSNSLLNDPQSMHSVEPSRLEEHHHTSSGSQLVGGQQTNSSGGGTSQSLLIALPSEEIKERNKCICLVIRGLSSWLVKSTLTPKSGNCLNSLYEQVSRNKLPGFLRSPLGQQYCQVKRLIDSFNRYSQFTNLNSISLSSNPNLLYMLDPTLIDEVDRGRASSRTFNTRNLAPPQPQLDFTQPQPVSDSIASLFKASMNLSQCNTYNLLFSSNLERTMINNLPTNTDSYFYYTQISLEGILKFLGQWSNDVVFDSIQLASQQQQSQKQQRKNISLADSLTNFVSSNNSSSVLLEDLSNKVINQVNELLLADEATPTSSTTSFDLGADFNSPPSPPPTTNAAANSGVVQRAFTRNNLDITSVLRTVLDYYESFSKNPCLQLKLDILRSMTYLANSVYDSRQQFEALAAKIQFNCDWLGSFVQQDIDNLGSFSLMPTVNDLVDESAFSTGIYAECLCRCSIQMSKQDALQTSTSMTSKDFERLNRLIENSLKSSSLSMKIATLHGLFYWLEAITLGYIGSPNEARQLTEHLVKQLAHMNDLSVYLTTNPRYVATLWSTMFYAIENCLDSIKDAQTFVGAFVKQTYNILNDPNTPYFLFYQIYMGLERFLLSNMVPSFEVNSIQKSLLSSKMAHDEQRSLCLISLTVTSLYASTNQFKQINYWHDIVAARTNSATITTSNSLNNISASNSLNNISGVSSGNNAANSGSNDTDPSSSANVGFPQILELTAYPELQAHLLKVLEVATNFFDRMKSSGTSREASIYANLLPKLLCDFLPPHDLLNKLITEFLNSSQHPYPEAVAYVLYKCFELLQDKGLQSQIQEWCLLSLSNFLQRASIHESVWLTSCLLVSATHNQWLKSTFPFLLNRYCAFETIDRTIFYMSVIEFRKQFTDKAHIHSLVSTFEAVAKPRTIYDELLHLLVSDSLE